MSETTIFMPVICHQPTRRGYDLMVAAMLMIGTIGLTPDPVNQGFRRDA